MTGASWDEMKTALLCAIEQDELEVVERLIAEQPNLLEQQLGSGHRSALHIASAGNKGAMLSFLIRAGAALEARDNQECTALHHAAMYGRLEAADLLLEAGANSSAQDSRGWTPLIWATRSHFALGERSVATLLLARGAELDLFSAIAMGRFSDAIQMMHQSPECVTHSNLAEQLLSVTTTTVTSIAGGRFTPGSADHPVHGEALTILRMLVEHRAPISKIDNAISSSLVLENSSIAEFLFEIAENGRSLTAERKLKLGRTFAFTAKNSGASAAMLDLLERYGYVRTS
jgi:ankyrin repeat protein